MFNLFPLGVRPRCLQRLISLSFKAVELDSSHFCGAVIFGGMVECVVGVYLSGFN